MAAVPTLQRVSFRVGDVEVVGNLHVPAAAADSPGVRYPAVIVAGPMTSVKEQVTGLYAAELAAQGFVALCIDPRHYGESGGEPRQFEYYEHKIEDYKAALDFLAGHELVDEMRMGAAGVCLGCGYAAHTALRDPRVKALGLVVGYYRDVPAMKSSDPAGFEEKVQQGRAARELYESTGEVQMIPAAALPGQGDAAMTSQPLFDYYVTKAGAEVPNYRNEFAVMSREHFLCFDVMSAAEQLQLPAVMVHSENGISPALARDFFGKLASADKNIHWLEGPNQTAFYYQTDLVSAAVKLIGEHFASRL
jgi:fermentation-respiration switch protein FrsA (DUF1100 family)